MRTLWDDGNDAADRAIGQFVEDIRKGLHDSLKEYLNG